MATKTRTIDTKGRIALPKGWANCLAIIEEIGENEIRIRKARAIPEQEAWLFNNPVALDMVQKGLEAAGRGDTAPTPDFRADFAEFADGDRLPGDV